jgi:hypothetical protein
MRSRAHPSDSHMFWDRERLWENIGNDCSGVAALASYAFVIIANVYYYI